MTQPITLVVLSTALDNFKEIRTALSTDSRLQLLAGGNDAEQVQEEIMRLKPSAAIILPLFLGASTWVIGLSVMRSKTVFNSSDLIGRWRNSRAPARKLRSINSPEAL